MTTHTLAAQPAAVTTQRILDVVQQCVGIGYDRDYSAWGFYRGTSSVAPGGVFGLRLGRLYGYVGYLNDSDAMYELAAA
jgi:hypothetical protein